MLISMAYEALLNASSPKFQEEGKNLSISRDISSCFPEGETLYCNLSANTTKDRWGLEIFFALKGNSTSKHRAMIDERIS